MPFQFERLSIPDVVLVRPSRLSDSRGFFSEVYKASEFASFGIGRNYCQTNHSRSGRDVLRGLHYQVPPMAQAKLLRVLSGRIFDAVVDLRAGSPFYAKHASVELDSEGGCLLFVPEGFAHGFCVLSESADIEYFCTAEYSKPHERGVRYDDPEIGIRWPSVRPLVSEKDQKLPPMQSQERIFVYEK